MKISLSTWMFALFFSCTSSAYALELRDVLQNMADQKQGQARFTELKYMAVLDKPAKSSGLLAFTAPSRIEKTTLEPLQESLVLDGETLVLTRGGKQSTIQLRSYPQVLGFVDAIRGLLMGDYQQLETAYVIQLSGSLESWKMSLSPRERRQLEFVRQINVTGGRGKLSSVEYIQNDGDYSVMKITPADSLR